MTDWRTEREQALVTLEQSKERGVRNDAAERLHELAVEAPDRWPELTELIPRLLADEQDDVRRVAVALGALMLEPEDAGTFLGLRMKDPSATVRLEAVGQLADLGRPEGRGVLAAGLQDPAFGVRFEAARGMATLRHSAGMEVLVEALEQDALRFRALGALAELGDPKALPAIQRVFKRWFLPGFERTQAAGALAKLGDADGGKHLLERAKGRWYPDRALAIELCGEVHAEGAFAQLLTILGDVKDACRGAAARGLGRLGNPEAAALLTKTLEERTAPEDLRLDAAEGLCLLQHEGVRAALERALPTFDSPAAREELEVMLADYL